MDTDCISLLNVDMVLQYIITFLCGVISTFIFLIFSAVSRPGCSLEELCFCQLLTHTNTCKTQTLRTTFHNHKTCVGIAQTGTYCKAGIKRYKMPHCYILQYMFFTFFYCIINILEHFLFQMVSCLDRIWHQLDKANAKQKVAGVEIFFLSFLLSSCKVAATENIHIRIKSHSHLNLNQQTVYMRHERYFSFLF